MDQKVTDLKRSYEEVALADNLDDVIRQAIYKGQKRRRSAARCKMAGIMLLFALTAFTAGVNTVPAFADSLGRVPVLSQLAKVLQFRDGKATGGEITDGKTVGPVTREPDSVSERIVIPIYEGENPATVTNYFEATYSAYPYTLTLDLLGVRWFFDGGNFPSFADSQLVEGMQKLVVLDDSQQRLLITFKVPVDITVTQTTNPAGLTVDIRAKEEQLPPAYSVRTASYPFGEEVGSLEERIREALGYPAETIRMLADKNGKLFVEAGRFATEQEAEDMKAALLAKEGINFTLTVEKREPAQLPATVLQ